MEGLAVDARDLAVAYGTREALRGITLAIRAGTSFALLGPNGAGKSTAFRCLSTLLRPDRGTVRIFGRDAFSERARARELLGVVFQTPGLDGKLTAAENLQHQGHLYGLSGAPLRERIGLWIARLGLTGREGDRVETLSGGLKRRVEIARALVHGPRLLLLDEPTTGLDPVGRRELGAHLRRLRSEEGVTVVMTTHHMDEAETCDEVAFIDGGAIVLSGAPAKLKEEIGGDVLSIRTSRPEQLAESLRSRFEVSAKVVEGEVRIERLAAHEMVPELMAGFGSEILSLTVGKPTLEDLFIRCTGRRLAAEAVA